MLVPRIPETELHILRISIILLPAFLQSFTDEIRKRKKKKKKKKNRKGKEKSNDSLILLTGSKRGFATLQAPFIQIPVMNHSTFVL